MNALTTTIAASTPTGQQDPELPNYHSAANSFLQREVYRLAAEPGLRSLPPIPERDFLTLTWGPIIYRTTYAPDSERLIPVFLRALNEEMARSLSSSLPGSPDQLRLLEKTYASKVFTDSEMFESIDEEAVRESFHDWKALLALPSVELPTRLTVCLMIDDGVLAHLTGRLDLASAAGKDADLSTCPVKVVEESFPDRRHRESGVVKSESYPGWTSVALRSLVELFDGLSRGNRLEDYHRPGKVYLGSGEWNGVDYSSI
jgi:hypothetical protein